MTAEVDAATPDVVFVWVVDGGFALLTAIVRVDEADLAHEDGDAVTAERPHEVTVGELAAPYDVSVQAVSRHSEVAYSHSTWMPSRSATTMMGSSSSGALERSR